VPPEQANSGLVAIFRKGIIRAGSPPMARALSGGHLGQPLKVVLGLPTSPTAPKAQGLLSTMRREVRSRDAKVLAGITACPQRRKEGSMDGQGTIRFDRPMKTAEVAKYLGLSEHQVRLMVRDGQIPAKKLGHCWYYSPGRIARLVGMFEDAPET
jgi:excisionase family DNA binding protein